MKQPKTKHQGEVDKKKEPKAALDTFHDIRQDLGSFQWSILAFRAQRPRTHDMEHIKILIEIIFKHCKEEVEGEVGENEEASIDVSETVETRLIPSYQHMCEVETFTNCEKEETNDWKKHILLVDKLRPLLLHDKSPYKISLTVEHFVHMFGRDKSKSRWQNIDEKADAIFHHKKFV